MKIQNVGAASVLGLETEVRYQATENLQLSINYGYTDAALTEDFRDLQTNTVAAADGSRLPGSSKNTLSLLIDWQMALTSNLDLQANANYIYVSSRTPALVTDGLTGSGFSDVPSSDVVNLSLGVAHNSGVNLSLFANNLLDDRNIQFEANIGAASGGLESANMNRPRTIGLRVGYQF